MSNPELNIDRAQMSDMPKIAGLIRSSAEWYKPFVAEKDMNEHYADEKWQKENFFKRDFYLGKQNQEPVGTISMQYFKETTYLGYIYLSTKHVGKGIGRRLIDFAKKKSKERGQKQMVLIAHPEATWAIKAYEKYGFKKKLTEREKILNWNNGLMKPYYEEGFHLYEYAL